MGLQCEQESTFVEAPVLSAKVGASRRSSAKFDFMGFVCENIPYPVRDYGTHGV